MARKGLVRAYMSRKGGIRVGELEGDFKDLPTCDGLALWRKSRKTQDARNKTHAVTQNTPGCVRRTTLKDDSRIRESPGCL